MPEQQASPTCSQPPPSTLENISVKSQTDDESAQSQSAKQTYLSLLPPPQLIDLILAIDNDRDTRIFPLDLNSAIQALQRPTQLTPAFVEPASGNDVQTIPFIKAEPSVITVPLSPTPSSSSVPPQQTAAPFSSAAPSTSVSLPVTSPASAPVQPPQYKPPPHKLQPHAIPQMYPHTHMPYYPPATVPVPPNLPQTSSSSSPVPPPAAPPRHPLFTSAPLSRDPTKFPSVKPTAPSTQVSSRDDPNAMPSYEEMLVEAIVDVGDADGTAPKVLFAWMASHYPLQQNFRPSASQALHKALRRGRLAKVGGKYRLNPEWGGGPTTSKRATRRPMAGNATMSPPAPTHSTTTPPTTIPQAVYHPTYGYHYAAHPPYTYYANPWIPGQPVVQPIGPSPVPNKVESTDDMEEDGPEREEIDGPGVSKPVVVPSKDQIKQSLIRLVNVLKRFSKKGEGTATDISKGS